VVGLGTLLGLALVEPQGALRQDLSLARLLQDVLSMYPLYPLSNAFAAEVLIIWLGTFVCLTLRRNISSLPFDQGLPCRPKYRQ
jgi:hypothetical protein